MKGMLSDILVVDLTRHLAGPFCTMILSDMGANVIKIEMPPDGDDSRTGGPFIKGEAGYFLSINRGKKGITLDLKTEEGRGILRRLIEKGDVLIESFRPGVMERLGFAYEEVAKMNPCIIYASLTGFGQYGPFREKGAYDVVIQGYGGTISITGNPGGEPVRVGFSIGDIAASLYTAIAVLGALHVRDQTGKGQYLDIAMLDCQVALLENALMRYTIAGEIPQPLGTKHPALAPFQVYQAMDGYFTVCAPHDKQFDALCQVLGIGDVSKENRFASNRLRVENLEELNTILCGIFKQNTRAYWIDVLEKAGVPAGPINDMKEVVDSPQIKAREMIVEVEHPIAGKIRLAGCPIKASLTPCSVQGPPPVLGQDTERVLKLLGYTEDQIAYFRHKKIV